ncbi:MAG TPA: HU family DNA-binding protein [Acidimicrobiales bacterium]|nr:HU family DNA-binding protein [Acidimicrobiales bacterium]
MNKTELIDKLAADTDLSKSQVSAVVSALEDTIVAEVKAGGKVSLPGFLTFEKGHRAARTGKNPQTGEALQIPAADVPKVKVGKGFKDAVNS